MVVALADAVDVHDDIGHYDHCAGFCPSSFQHSAFQLIFRSLEQFSFSSSGIQATGL